MKARLNTAILIVVAFVLIGVCVAEESRQAASVNLPHIQSAPRLEQFVAGSGRSDMAKITDFRQREPKDAEPASLPTTAYVGYDDAHFYAVFVCKDIPSRLRAHMSKRDHISGDDAVSLSLDTFHDGHRAYAFYSNPIGVQSDAMTTEGQDDDYSYDGVWSSEGKIVNDGYIVLI